MQLRNEKMFRRIEELMADGAGYEIASVLAFNEYVESLVDRADTERKRDKEHS